MLAKVGYSKGIAKHPVRVIDTPGVQSALAEMGFSAEGAKSVVQEIMYDGAVDPNARLRATDQVFKVVGAYVPESKPFQLNLNPESEKLMIGTLNIFANQTQPKFIESDVVDETDKNDLV